MTDPRYNGFFMLTGFTFLAFASGFGVCLFNLETVDACIETSSGWVDVFHSMGDHLIQWAFLIFDRAFHS